MTTPPAHAYCTYFDSGYLSRGLALIDSLRRHGDDAPVWVLCLDDAAHEYLTELADPSIRPIMVDALEDAEPGLSAVKPGRSRMEYYFTCTPLLMRYVMDQHDVRDGVVIYLDADLYFFDRPALVLDALGDGSVGIIEHRYPPRLERRLAKYGRFNVGWVGIRNDDNGRSCLNWWAEQCLEWCFDVPSDGRYADQGYLNEFPSRFDGVRVLSNAGFNLAPWNTGRHDIAVTTSGGSPAVTVDDGQPLVFFHFHGIKAAGGWFITSQLVYGSPMSRRLREYVYAPYIDQIVRCSAEVSASGHAIEPVVARRGKGVRGLIFRAQRFVFDRAAIVTANAVKPSRADRPATH
ncbi:hypothetical protein ASE14_05445 [Agromyces sp. Root81]|uniref:hypothetical protein n=1 Tax=Agromyces sp. Root81 TaxID=1736601 RepID=UPI0006FAE819|nr:hypothetical protein [Agromyces sp. Root81]KRC60465.1 hypothetical protein ASE14_05445 [Agromyces sp. Root81]